MPTPPPYLRRMRLSHGRGACIRWVIRLALGQGRISRYQSLSFQAQNRDFCAILAFGTLVFGRFEHKIEVFVRFWPSVPTFSGISSTKSRFLCAFRVWNPHFRAFRAQNRGFCALLAFGALVFGHFEHKIAIFVRGFCILAGNYWTWVRRSEAQHREE